ncbi:transcriptional regulator [Skermanella stibiiresistens SB22]|uniref:Transcriptional regulator n=1 Tax=Skermanella stibiiresistens SB22 TaxID=1385369 RepID=W9H723_9PROT|nr:response regulator [Skermanella stibiiresistens]EWY39573.1 transcriptional regulator [Skermanella stibiiresistens SB22]
MTNDPVIPAVAAIVGADDPTRNLYGIDLGIPLEDRRVLVVDESKFNQKTLARFLLWAGIHQVAFASGGQEALDMVETFAPDLVLIDITLPDMDGIEVCERLRRKKSQMDLSILVQTVVTSDILRTICFRAGANDVLSKPINPGECIARVRYHLERRAIIQELREFRERVEKDLRMAQAMQVGIAPEEEAIAALAAKHNLDIAVHFQPCNEIGGDFWTMFEIDENRIGVLIADFSGHGIPAAINTFRLHTLITREDVRALSLDPAAMLAKLSAGLLGMLPLGHFATALYGVIDTSADLLTFAAAGTTNPVIGDAEGLRLLDGSGVFLGICEGEVYENITEPFPSGSFLFIYSDALVECRSPTGAMLGEPGLLDLIIEHRDFPIGPLIPIVADVLKTSGMRVQDDLTAIWITRP